MVALPVCAEEGLLLTAAWGLRAPSKALPGGPLLSLLFPVLSSSLVAFCSLTSLTPFPSGLCPCASASGCGVKGHARCSTLLPLPLSARPGPALSAGPSPDRHQ